MEDVSSRIQIGVKRLSAVAVSALIALSFTGSKAYAYDELIASSIDEGATVLNPAVQDDSTSAKTVETYVVDGSGSKKYTIGQGTTFVPVTISKAGYADIKVSLSGAQDTVHIISLDTDFKQILSTGISPKESSVKIPQGAASPTTGTIAFMVDSEKDKDSSIVVELETEFTPLTTAASAVSAGDKIYAAQGKGQLFWQVTISALSKLNLNSDARSKTTSVTLYDSEKKAIDADYLASGAKRYLLAKGTYYISTKVDKSIDLVSFSYTTTKVNAVVSSNTTLKKAKSLKLKKAVMSAITNSPTVKAHYYKFKINKARNISVSYNDASAEQTVVTVLNSKGKPVAYSAPNAKKKGTYAFYKNGDDYSASTTSKIKLSKKGMYYIKVEPAGTGNASGYGKYSITVK